MTHFYIIDLGYGNLPSLLRFFSNLGTVSILKSPLEFSPSSYNLTVLSYRVSVPFLKLLTIFRLLVLPLFFFHLLTNQVSNFGICLGMQLLASRGCEGGNATGLDLIPVVLFQLVHLRPSWVGSH